MMISTGLDKGKTRPLPRSGLLEQTFYQQKSALSLKCRNYRGNKLQREMGSNHFDIRTENACAEWVRRFILIHIG